MTIEELKQAMQRMTVYVQQLQLQLNLLSTGRLAPSIITPENLRKLLLDIKEHLLSNQRLPGYPSTDLWRFYQILTRSTVPEKTRILVFVSIPLLNIDDELELYEVHNLPLPPPFMRGQATTGATMTARYELEAYALAVDIRRTTVALLDRLEFETCSKPLLRFCDIKSPMYPYSLHQFCVTALFANNNKLIKDRCNAQVQLSTQLPVAEYLSNGAWAIRTVEPLTIRVVCDDKASTQLLAQPPRSIQILNMSCTGFSDKVTLSPYYSVESNFPITDKMAQWVLDYSISNVTLWAPFQSSVVNHTAVTLPKKLAPLPIIPMGRHIHELNEIQKHKQKRGCSFWTYLAIISAVLLIMGLATAGEVFYLGYGRGVKLWTGRPFRTGWRAREAGVPDPDPTSVAAPDAVDDDDVDRATPSAPSSAYSSIGSC